MNEVGQHGWLFLLAHRLAFEGRVREGECRGIVWEWREGGEVEQRSRDLEGTRPVDARWVRDSRQPPNNGWKVDEGEAMEAMG